MNSKVKGLRSEQEIFADLRCLAQSTGALHGISKIIYRDWVQTVDLKEGVIVDPPHKRWSTAKLNTNELLLLLGLLVQSTTRRAYDIIPSQRSFLENADSLLMELHDKISAAAASVLDPSSRKFLDKPDALGMFAREAIYYGPASFYLHQFGKFARYRYRMDQPWLLRNAGLSIRPMIDIADFICQRITAQMNAVGQMKVENKYFDDGYLTSSLMVPKKDLREHFGDKADAFIERFSTPIKGGPTSFDNPFAINPVSLAPLIDFGDYLYVPSQYRIFESVYESPFYWMINDNSYAPIAAKNRGAFLEETAAHVLKLIFGDDNVFVNAEFPAASNKVGAEVDVLVRYGEFVLVVQAKSKRVTLRARAGDPEALKNDFKGAIQDPYEQALASGEFVRVGAKCVDRDGRSIDLPHLPRIFPIVLLSDMFPAATMLSRSMLSRAEGQAAPVVWDIAILDCVTRILPSPIEMIFYLKARGDIFDSVISDSEYNYLGYHLRAKLSLPPDTDMMVIDRDFATVVDDYMVSADLGIKAKRPEGVLEAIDIPLIAALLTALKSAPPAIAALVVDLYEFSYTAMDQLSGMIENVRAEIKLTRKVIKAFSLPTANGGLTYAVVLDASERSHIAAVAIGRKHKYATKSDRWYVILDSIATEQPVDGLLPLVWPWKEDEQEREDSELTSQIFRSWYQEAFIDEPTPRVSENTPSEND